MNLIRTKSQNRIAKEFFKGFTNHTLVKKELNFVSKYKSIGAINQLVGKWKKKGYIIKKSLPHPKKSCKDNDFFARIPKCILNLNFFFDYLSHKKIYLNQSEKNYLNLIFSEPKVRIAVCELFKDETLAEGILKFYVRFLVMPYSLKEGYITNYKKIKNDKEYQEMINDFLKKDSKYKKKIQETKQNQIKISNTKKVELMCIKHLALHLEEGKDLKDLKKKFKFFIKVPLRETFVNQRELKDNKDFLIKLDKKMMFALGIYNI